MKRKKAIAKSIKSRAKPGALVFKLLAENKVRLVTGDDTALFEITIDKDTKVPAIRVRGIEGAIGYSPSFAVYPDVSNAVSIRQRKWGDT